MNTFFTSDFHFGHKLMCQTRKFASIEEHDETIISNFNSLVKYSDITYFLGDFCWSDFNRYINRLNGNFHFIKGNHDKQVPNSNKILSYNEGYKNIYIGKQPITLCHFQMATWEKSHFGAWHIYGHTHGFGNPVFGKMMNVALDCTCLRPLSFEEVSRFMDTMPDNWNLIRR